MIRARCTGSCAAQAQPDLIIVELGEHLLAAVHQRLFSLPVIQQQGCGIVLTAVNRPPLAQTVATLRSFATLLTACRFLAIVSAEQTDVVAKNCGVESNQPYWVAFADVYKHLASLTHERLCPALARI